MIDNSPQPRLPTLNADNALIEMLNFNRVRRYATFVPLLRSQGLLHHSEKGARHQGFRLGLREGWRAQERAADAL
ncbi:MAG: hypothetical protein AAGA50_04550 [Pseudomonadota bacterium]